jgi:FMN phosphatase YigB (HAD superfamily)
MNKVILFDIDYTLFNNDRFVELKDNQIIEIIGIKDVNKYKSILPKYLDSLNNHREFNPSDFLDLVCNEFCYKNKKTLEELTYNSSILYKSSLFGDVVKSLKSLSKDYALGIFSEANDIKFQKHKLNSLGIGKYFDKDLIFIIDAKDTKEVIDKLPKKCVIVDDKESICNFLTENGIRAIWLNRKDGRKSEKYQTIFSLLELPELLTM